MTEFRRGIYAGSFDPLTLGHLDVIRRACGLVDELVVGVGNNPAKRYLFPLAQREDLVREACGELPVRVVSFEGLLVDACRREQAGVIVRGLRSVSDFDSEFRYGLANRDISGIETIFLLSDPAYLFVSSSIVREIEGNGGDASRYVPDCVARALAARGRR